MTFPTPYIFGPSDSCRFPISFFSFHSCSSLTEFCYFLVISQWLLQWSCHPCRFSRRSVFVSTLASTHFVRMFIVCSLCVLTVSVAEFTLSVMASIAYGLLVAGTSVVCIGEVMTVSLVVTRRLMSTCLLFTIERKKCMDVGMRQFSGLFGV